MINTRKLFEQVTKEENIKTDVQVWQSILGKDYEPDILIAPESGEEIAKIVKIANQNMIPVYPLGSGSQFNRGIPPFKGGVLLSTSNLKKIVEYRPGNMSIEVEAGLTLEELANFLSKDNLYFPIKTSTSSCTLGGMVSRNEYGKNKYMYHTIRNYVMGIEFISPEGEIIRAGGRTVKNVSSLDISQLLTGSWGTLGIITRITLRVKPIPEANTILELKVDNINDLCNIASVIFDEKLSLASLTFSEQDKCYFIQLELEGFKDTIELQVKYLQEKYKFELSKPFQEKGVSTHKISLTLDKYSEGLVRLAKLAKGEQTSVIFKGNFTNGTIELEIEKESEVLLKKIATLVQELEGTFVSQNRVVIEPDRGIGYLNILKTIKGNVDPKNILVPQSLALKE